MLSVGTDSAPGPTAGRRAGERAEPGGGRWWRHRRPRFIDGVEDAVLPALWGSQPPGATARAVGEPACRPLPLDGEITVLTTGPGDDPIVSAQKQRCRCYLSENDQNLMRAAATAALVLLPTAVPPGHWSRS